MGGQTIDYQSVAHADRASLLHVLPADAVLAAGPVRLGQRRRQGVSAEHGLGHRLRAGRQFAREKSRLRCAWRRSNPTKDGLHPILDVRGRGHYVGNFLQVHTKFDGWWGEGDTIFHRDGKKITHTPGTEDEYGACWGFGNTYSYLYSGYLQNDKGNNRMYRWYLPNPVRFRESLKVEIQNQHDNGTPTTTDADDYTSIAYWYQEEPPSGSFPATAMRNASPRARPARERSKIGSPAQNNARLPWTRIFQGCSEPVPEQRHNLACRADCRRPLRNKFRHTDLQPLPPS